jgi:hypothetical protein
MVAGDGEQAGGRAEGLEVLPQLGEGVAEAIEFLGCGALGEVAGEEDEVPRAAALVQLARGR